MWFTRNLIIDRAGYCFGSALGRAVFDNSDCTGRNLILPPDVLALVEAILDREGNCMVDTTATTLDMRDVEWRKRMIDLPMPVGEESTCIGWLKDPFPLRRARSEDAPKSVMVQPGDTLLFQFEDVDAWSFVELSRDGAEVGVGWAVLPDLGEDCEMIAG